MTTGRAAREVVVVRRLLGLVREQRWFLLPAVVFGVLAFAVEGVGLAMFVPLLRAFTDVEPDPAAGVSVLAALHAVVERIPPTHRVGVLILVVFAAIALKNLLAYANTAIFVVADGHASDALRRRAYAHTLALPLARVERDSSGRLLNAIGTETWRVSHALGALFSGVTSLCAIVVFVPLLLLLSWPLTLVALGLMSAVPLVTHLLSRRAEALGRTAVAANTQLSERMWASLAGIRVIRAFGREAMEAERFAAASDAVRRCFMGLGLITAAAGPATEILITLIIAVLGLLMDPRVIGLPTLAAFVAVLYRLQPHARQLIDARVTLLGLAAAVDELQALVDTPEDPALRRGGRIFHGLREEIRLEGVGFTYPGSTVPALVDVSFAIPRGAMVAIVGPSGAGKSTLLDVILGFHAPDPGRVLVDGTPLDELDVGSWRRRLGVVGQDGYVADGSLRDNVLYGRPEASRAELEEAAAAVALDAFIHALPRGWDTPVGERGVRLSGGERQRLALARALVRKPDLLLLDEATNALDSRTERDVQQALARCVGHSSLVVVAHRLATIERADLIVVLDHGRVVETGSFATLVHADGLFALMYRLQSLGQNVPGVA